LRGATPSGPSCYAKARYLDPTTGRFITADSFPGVPEVPASIHPYAYAHNAPTTYTDPSGQWVEDAVLGVPALVLGAKSLWDNVKAGNYGDATLDAVGVTADAAAIALPGVPGGAGFAIRGTRYAIKGAQATKAIRTRRTVDRAIGVGRGSGATVELEARGESGWATATGVLTALGIKGLGKGVDELSARVGRSGPGGVLGIVENDGISAISRLDDEVPALVGLEQRAARRTGVDAALAESRAARDASRFGDYAQKPAVVGAERRTYLQRKFG
jgi:RHS repeat-associated protein